MKRKALEANTKNFVRMARRINRFYQYVLPEWDYRSNDKLLYTVDYLHTVPSMVTEDLADWMSGFEPYGYRWDWVYRLIRDIDALTGIETQLSDDLF